MTVGEPIESTLSNAVRGPQEAARLFWNANERPQASKITATLELLGALSGGCPGPLNRLGRGGFAHPEFQQGRTCTFLQESRSKRGVIVKS